MKKALALILALICALTAFALPSSADISKEDQTCYIFWAYGTRDEYFMEKKNYAVGDLPTVPNVTPTKEDPTRLFHFVYWDKPPQPINNKEDHYFYYAMYKVYEKKYAMNHDTEITISDVTTLLDVLSGDDIATLSNPDINADGTASIQDVTLLLDYLATANPPIVSAKTLLQEGKQS